MQGLEQSGCVVSTSRSTSHRGDPIVPEISGSPALGASQNLGAPSSEDNGPWSCSGVVLDQGLGIVLCHGSIFVPFLLTDTALDCSEQRRLLMPEDFSQNLVVKIQCRAGSKNKGGNVKNNLHADAGVGNPELGLIPLSNQVGSQGSTRKHQALLLGMVSCEEFRNTFCRLFNKAEGWRFSSEEEKLEDAELQKDLAYLHWFAVLKIKYPATPATAETQFMPATSLQKGSVLFTCGSPFGTFYPDIFLNTLSKGVVSNLAGEGNVVILTDARCLPGTEGGGVFAMSEGHLVLVGLVVVPLCWKANEWVGLTVVCSVSHILENVKRALPSCISPLKDLWPKMTLVPKRPMELVDSSALLSRLASSAVLVDCGHVWGSGALVNTRTVLTCRHVVSGASRIVVRRKHQTANIFRAIRGKVVFATKESSPFDIAVVELEESFLGFAEPVLGSRYLTGEDVNIVGFGAFGQHCGPSVTSGILSAVFTMESTPVMLQTTCAVHSGSSGGPLFSTRTGELLGIVASNTRDNNVGASYPHLNFSIPITVMQAGLSLYNKNGDLGGFEELHRASYSVRAVWRLQRKPKHIKMSKL